MVTARPPASPVLEQQESAVTFGHGASGPTRRDRVVLLVQRIAALAVVLGAWELFALANPDASFFVGRPSAIAERLVEWVVTGYLWFHVAATVQHMILGFLVGAALGVTAGVVLGLMPRLGSIVDPYLTALYSLPRIALAPLFVLWFGIGATMKVALAATIVFFLVFWNTYAGVRERDEELLNVLRVMGASRLELIRKVILPGAMTYVFVGLKLSVPYSLVGAVVGEMIASSRGMGWLLMSAAGQFDTSGLFAGLVVLMVVATTINALLNRAQARLMRWQVDKVG